MNAQARSYYLCAGMRIDGLPCSRIVSFAGSYCPRHIDQRPDTDCDCDGCADFTAIVRGPSRLHSGRS